MAGCGCGSECKWIEVRSAVAVGLGRERAFFSQAG